MAVAVEKQRGAGERRPVLPCGEPGSAVEQTGCTAHVLLIAQEVQGAADHPRGADTLQAVLELRDPHGPSSRARRSRQQTKDRIAELFLRGETQGNAPGSKWAAVNAIVEYGDWIRPLRSSVQRFARALDDGAEKTRALQLVAAA